MADLGCTPGQTVGPFFADALSFPADNSLIGAGHPEAIRLHGKVYDGADQPITDGLVEVWQPGLDGGIVRWPGALRRDAARFTGWGRCATDEAGRYEFTTLRPPAFFALTVFARGLLDRLFTRAYLPGGNLVNDPVLRTADACRRKTLVAELTSEGYRFDIRLQGPRETIFFEYRGAW